MTARNWIIGAVLLVAGCANGPNAPAPQRLSQTSASSRVDTDDPEMAQAITKAKQTLDEFLARLQHPQRNEVFSVQSAFKTPSGPPEYLWLGDVTYKDGVFEGAVNTKPQRALTPKYGETAKVKKEDVTDWMILKSGKSEGGFTVDLLLKRQAAPR
ncbi:MAG TPA: DUF2314 domain-containing protein [Fimbriimonadaceae bacterium]|nr:DUF2314 domain-containing protein [Fimbriimonadaceae bacterium]